MRPHLTQSPKRTTPSLRNRPRADLRPVPHSTWDPCRDILTSVASEGSTKRRRLLFVVVALAALGIHAPGASAEEDSEIVVDGTTATVTVVAAGPITLGDGAPGASPYWPYTCNWDEPWTNSDVIISPTDTPIPGHRYYLRCIPDEDSDLPAIGEFVIYDPLDPIPGFAAVTSIEIRDFARDFVQPNPLPVGISPDGIQITGVETWLWPDGSLDRVRASANANGLTVTVEARYRGTTFDLGLEGVDKIVCTEQVEWTPGMESTPCAYTYLLEAENVTIDAESEWDFVWWDNAAQPVPALFETITPNEVLELAIIDLEAVISNGK